MKVILRKFIKFFEINIGWFFVNGNKLERWNNYIHIKYFHKKD
jgi:hypothetical protein